jgi:hypothetical protein
MLLGLPVGRDVQLSVFTTSAQSTLGHPCMSTVPFANLQEQQDQAEMDSVLVKLQLELQQQLQPAATEGAGDAAGEAHRSNSSSRNISSDRSSSSSGNSRTCNSKGQL